MTKQPMELIKNLLADMTYDETVRSGIWKHKMDTYQDFYHHCHSDLLPDDIRYKMIHDLLSSMSEYETIDDIRDNDYEILDSNTLIYTSDILNWLSSNNIRYTYIDIAIENYGKSEHSILEDITNGYREELTEVLYLILEWIEDNYIDE